MLYDNLPTAPGALLGHRKNGQPIYLIAGGSGEGETDSPANDTPADPAPADPPQPTGGDPDPETRPDRDPAPTQAAPDEHTRKTIEAIRGDFKDERAKRQAAEAQAKKTADELAEFKKAQQAQNAALAKALGFGDKEEPPDPAKLAEDLAAERSERDKLNAAVRDREVQLAVLKNAGKHDADGVALLDSRSFLKKVEGLDPDAGDFENKVAEAITAAIEANPRYKLTPTKPAPKPKPEPTVPKSGGEFNGSPGGNRQWTEEDVARASPQQVTEAMAAGLLQDLGFAAPRPKR